MGVKQNTKKYTTHIDVGIKGGKYSFTIAQIDGNSWMVLSLYMKEYCYKDRVSAFNSCFRFPVEEKELQNLFLVP